MPERPNVLILWCDQMQHQRLGFLDGIAHTPNLDRLAGEGIHFSHAISVHGQCVPSRAAVITGQSPHECGVMVNYGFFNHQNRLSDRHQTLAKVFGAAGYETVYYGKSHLGAPLATLGFEQGHGYDGVHIDDAEAEAAGFGHVPAPLRRDYQAAADAVKFLQDYQPGERPLFFVFSTNLPHPPFFLETEHAARFAPADMRPPLSFYEETFAGKPAYQQEHAADGRHGAEDGSPLIRMMMEYYSMIAMMDEHFGQVMEQFERLGLWDNTVVLFFADHGDMMGAHKMRLKGTLPYDELYRIPCIMKLPKGMPSTRRTIDDLVSSQAFAGTLTRLAGLEVPAEFTGGDFADALTRDQHPDEEHVFFEHYAAYWGLHPFYGVRTRDWKYVRYYGPDQCEELYDLAADPHELQNVAADPASAESRQRLAALADNWWQTTGGQDADYYESANFKANLHNLE